MADKLKATVFIPVYNGERDHLEETLSALYRQVTDFKWDVLITDSGSSDNSVAIFSSTLSFFLGFVRKSAPIITQKSNAAAISQKVGFLKFRIPFTLCFTPTSPNANGQTVIIFPDTWNESRTSEYSFFCSALQSFITRSSHAISMSRQNKMYASQQNGLNQYTANST